MTIEFSVIYSFDCARDAPLKWFNPPTHQINGQVWQCTEKDDQRALGYLDGWENCRHRKWCATLTKEQFVQFAEHVGLSAYASDTAGMIGALGFGVGWVPAFAFDLEANEACGHAYVCPLVPIEYKTGTIDRPENWERLKRATEALLY